jgi:hypothetical protein
MIYKFYTFFYIIIDLGGRAHVLSFPSFGSDVSTYIGFLEEVAFGGNIIFALNGWLVFCGFLLGMQVAIMMPSKKETKKLKHQKPPKLNPLFFAMLAGIYASSEFSKIKKNNILFVTPIVI